MESVWRLDAPRIGCDRFLPDERVEVAVVGGGLTGVLTALLLARAGLRTTVLEARRTGAVTTGNTTGKLSLLQGTVLSDILAHAGEDVLRAYVTANREGQAWMLRELGSLGVAVERSPAFTYANSEEGAEALEREREASLLAELPVRREERTGLPFPTAGSIGLDDQAQLQPITALAVFAESFRKRGGRLVEGCRVQGVEVEGDSVTLSTTLGSVTAESVVLATGTPILDRGLFFARLEPSRSVVAAYELASERLPRGMYLSVDEPARCGRRGARAVQSCWSSAEALTSPGGPRRRRSRCTTSTGGRP